MGDTANSPSSSTSEQPPSSACSEPIAERDEELSISCSEPPKQVSDSTPGVFRQGSSVCIFEIFPAEYMNVVQVNLDVLANLCPVNASECPSIIGIKFRSIERGIMQGKKAKGKGRGNKNEDENPRTLCGNRFQHQVQLRMRLPGAENISIKFFKTGRLQTAGCRTREMSVRAVQDVATALALVVDMEGGEAVLNQCEPDVAVQLCKTALDNVRVSKECILGSFSTGFSGPRGKLINMRQLAAMLSTLEFKKTVESIKFNGEPSSHEAKFKQLGIYLRKDHLKHADQAVFVNIFSSGKCTVTAATSIELAEEVMHTVTDILCSNYDRIVEDRRDKLPAGPPRGRATSSSQLAKFTKNRRQDSDEKSTGSSGESSEGSSSGTNESMKGSSAGSSIATMPDDYPKAQLPDMSKSHKGMVPMMQVLWCPPDMVPSFEAAGWCQPGQEIDTEKESKHGYKEHRHSSKQQPSDMSCPKESPAHAHYNNLPHKHTHRHHHNHNAEQLHTFQTPVKHMNNMSQQISMMQQYNQHQQPQPNIMQPNHQQQQPQLDLSLLLSMNQASSFQSMNQNLNLPINQVGLQGPAAPQNPENFNMGNFLEQFNLPSSSNQQQGDNFMRQMALQQQLMDHQQQQLQFLQRLAMPMPSQPQSNVEQSFLPVDHKRTFQQSDVSHNVHNFEMSRKNQKMY